MKRLIILGTGGHAKSVIDCLDSNIYELFAFIDLNTNGNFLGFPVLSEEFLESNEAKNYSYFIAIGDNNVRDKLYNKISKLGLDIINIIDKSAIISKSAKIGVGCFVGKYAVINSCAIIGDNCIINTKALIEHECIVGKSSHISTNSTLNGGVSIGNLCFIGSSSSIKNQVVVGNSVTIGMGSVVLKNVPDNKIYVGNPARMITKEGVKS